MKRITVYGTPAPQGSKSNIPIYKGKGPDRVFTGKIAPLESSKKVKPWRQDVKAAALEARDGSPPLEGPLAVHIAFTLKRPASVSVKRRPWPYVKPDLDKLIRSTLDGLGESGIFVDDAQVVTIVAAKLYVGFPGALDAPGALIDICVPVPTATIPDPLQQEGLLT